MTESRKKTQFLQKRDRWGHGVSLWIVVIVGFLLPVMAWSLKDLELKNDVTEWLPKNDVQYKIWKWYEGMFPSKARVLVSWDSASITDSRLVKLQEQLEGPLNSDGIREGGSPYVEAVSLPTAVLARMVSRDIPFETAIDQLDGVLLGKGPLNIRLTDAGVLRGEYMQKEILRIANKEFQLNAELVTRHLSSASAELIPEGGEKAEKMLEQMTTYVNQQPLYHLQMEWPQMHSSTGQLQEFKAALLSLKAPGSGAETAGKACVAECFVTPGSLAAVSVALSEAGAAEKEKAVAAIRQAVKDSGVPEETIRLGGQPVVVSAMNHSVGEAVWNSRFEKWDLPHRSPIFFSAFVSVFFSFVMLRSFRLAVLVQAVSFLVVIFAVGFVPLSGGAMSMVLIVMPTLLAVLTTSAAIHLANYWKHSGSSDPIQSVLKAVETAWLPCLLASGTTAIGLASLLVSNLIPVRDFGIYSALGCLLSFVVVLYVLPSLMLYWPKSPPQAEQLDTSHWERFGVWLARHRHAVCLCCVAVTVAASWGFWNFKTETKVIRYFPTESRLVQDYVFLEDKLSGVISIDTIVKFDVEAQQLDGYRSVIERARTVMALQKEIRNHPEISGVLSLASFLDLNEPEGGKAKKILFHRKASKDIREMVTGAKEDKHGLATMLAVPDFSTDRNEDGDQLLNREGDEVWRITAQTSALSDTDLEVLIADMDAIAQNHLALVGSPNTGHVVTGLIPVFLRTQQAVLESLIRSFGMAFLIIAIVMMVLLRSFRAGVITMLPNLMPVFVVFGLLSWMHLKVDIGTMITASVALGIAVDGTLHMLTWFQVLVRRGHSVDQAVGKALAHSGPAMWQTSTAIGLGMLALLPAELLLVSRFGLIMAALIFAALVADIVFLPALLGGTLGRLIQRAALRDGTAATVEKVEPNTNTGDDPPQNTAADAATTFLPAAEVMPELH